MFTKIAARMELSLVQAHDWDCLILDLKVVRFVAKFMLKIDLLGQFLDVKVKPDAVEALPGGEDPPGIQDLEAQALGQGF
jgi:hypothetical protein